MKRLARHFAPLHRPPIQQVRHKSHEPQSEEQGARDSWQRFVRGAGKESPGWLQHAARMQSGEVSSALDVLEERGLIKDVTGDREHLRQQFIDRRMSIYCGVDPTASSLHLGHLVPLNLLFWLHACGHHCTSLIGAFTAEVGDPTDRLTAREQVQKETRKEMIDGIKDQLTLMWRNAATVSEARGMSFTKEEYGFREDLGPRRLISSNSEWLSRLSLKEWLRLSARNFKVGAMLSRDSVKLRLERGESMTLAEFTYPSLQAYDFWHMFRARSVEVQVGGSDQYGNILAGVELIDHQLKHNPDDCSFGLHHERRKPYGITTPLLTTSAGEKFGKSAGNAIWLNPNLTSPFELYGHLLRTADADAERFLKLLTLVPSAQIAEVMEAHATDPGKRAAQHLLAMEVCTVAHGPVSAAETQAAHRKRRAPSVSSMLGDAAHRSEQARSPTSTVVTEAGGTTHKESSETSDRYRTLLPRSIIEHLPAAQVMVLAGLADSGAKAKMLWKQGGLYGGRKREDDNGATTENGSSSGSSTHEGRAGDDELVFAPFGREPQSAIRLVDWVIDDRLLVLRSGKWRTYVVEVVDDAEFDRRGLSIGGQREWRDLLSKQA